MYKALRFGVIATIFSLFISAPASASDTGIAYALHDVRAEKGKVCMVGHFHYGKTSRPFPSRDIAQKAAIRHWSTFTAAEYGSDWGSYGRAASRSANCEKVSRTNWTCKVKARACRSGRSTARR